MARLVVSLAGRKAVNGYHDRNYGAAVYHLRAGKGRLLVCLLPQIHPVVRQRVLQNSIGYLMMT